MSKIETKRQFPSLVYSTTRWQETLFSKRAQGTKLASVISSTAKGLSLEGENQGKAGGLGLEVFSRLYDDPEKLETPDSSSPWAEKVHGMLDEMEEFKALSELTSSDPDMAALATAEMLQAVESKLPELVKEEREAQAQQAQGQGQPGQESGQGPVVQGFQLTAADKVRSVLRGAARDARQMVQEAKSMLEGIAPGLGAAPSAHEQEDPRRAALAQVLMSNQNLRKIVELAGRLERMASKVKKERNPDLREEVVDIERGGDLGRILPSELGGLKSSRIRRLLTLQKITDQTALQYRLEGRDPLGRGEMIVALDESGSMGMEQGGIIPNVWARAIGLACLQVARKDRRTVTIVGFNGGLTSRHRMEKNGSCHRWDGTSWVPMEGGMASLALEVISKGCGGGTSFDAPILFAIDALSSSSERPDLLFVTDGEAYVVQNVLETLAKAKKEKGLRVFGVAMGHGSITEAMESVCDHSIDFAPDIQKVAKVIPG